MTLTLLLDPARLWHWHAVLAAGLEGIPGNTVEVQFAARAEPLPVALALALQLEQTLARRDAPHAFDRADPQAFARWSSPAAAPMLTIDLATAVPSATTGARTVIPLYDGAAGEAAFWSALLDGRAPALALAEPGAASHPIGQPAIENPHALRTSAAAVITRLIDGLVRTARGPALAQSAPPEPTARGTGSAASPSTGAAVLLARKFATKARRVLDRQLGTAPQWATAWRTRAPGFDPLDTAALDPAAFHHLPDDGQRYFADPFPFCHGGRVDLFVEELPYATGRGIVSLTTLHPDGTASAPRPVLEQPFHLSYPQIIARDGAIWMLPEASASGGLILYRATRYPDGWEPVARLIDEPLHDATLFEHGGRLWIAACTQGPAGARWGSSWDSLSLYSADRLLGPWTPHPANPVLIDAGSARPAGRVFTHGGRLVRPVQDCSRGYGHAVGLATILNLTTSSYVQSVQGWLTCAQGSGLLGPHTLNRIETPGGTVEAIDLFGPRTAIAAAAVGTPPRRTL